MPTLYLPLERSEWFKDKDGVWTTSKHTDEVKPYSFDYTDVLNSGETISTSSWDANGVTTSSPALATPVATVTVTGTDGSLQNTLVTSASRTLVYTYRFVGVPTGAGSRDYGA